MKQILKFIVVTQIVGLLGTGCAHIIYFLAGVDFYWVFYLYIGLLMLIVALGVVYVIKPLVKWINF